MRKDKGNKEGPCSIIGDDDTVPVGGRPMKIGVTSEPIMLIMVILLSAVLFAGCIGTGEEMTNETNATTVGKQGNPVVTFITTKGTFKAEIYLDKAPITAGNFLKLVKSDFYNGLAFHRYVPGFVIQGGDPSGDGTGGSEDTIKLEIVPELTHVKGALAMARTMDPNSASSQFYVAVADIHQLDGQYAVFGMVTEGMDVVMQLRESDKMTGVTVEE